MTEQQSESNRIVKYQEFIDNPETVIDACNASGEPVIVTKHGRLMFLIEPLMGPQPSE